VVHLHRSTPALFPLALHDALPIFAILLARVRGLLRRGAWARAERTSSEARVLNFGGRVLGLDALELRGGERRYQLTQMECDLLRSEEHTSGLQSRENLVCRLLLVK